MNKLYIFILCFTTINSNLLNILQKQDIIHILNRDNILNDIPELDLSHPDFYISKDKTEYINEYNEKQFKALTK